MASVSEGRGKNEGLRICVCVRVRGLRAKSGCGAGRTMWGLVGYDEALGCVLRTRDH